MAFGDYCQCLPFKIAYSINFIQDFMCIFNKNILKYTQKRPKATKALGKKIFLIQNIDIDQLTAV